MQLANYGFVEEHCRRNASAADMNIRITPKAMVTMLQPKSVEFQALTF